MSQHPTYLASLPPPKKHQPTCPPEDSISNVSQNFPVIFAAASKPNGSLRVRQAHMGGSNVWVLVAEETSASEAFSDAAFVVETGLLGALDSKRGLVSSVGGCFPCGVTQTHPNN